VSRAGRSDARGAASTDASGTALRVVHHTGQTPGALSRLLDAHERALREGAGVLKNKHGTAVTRVRRDGEDLCVKQYRRPGALDRAKDLLRRSRAERAWRAATYLASRGVATPEAVAVLERGGTRYLVTRFVDGSAPLKRLLAERFTARPSAREIAAKRSLVRALGRWLRRLHALGIYHDDCSAKNVLCVEGEAGWAFHLLDLDGVAPGRRLSYPRRVKNLSQLVDPPASLTRADCMRLLLAYAEDEPVPERRRLARDVAAAARRRSASRARAHERHMRRKARRRSAGERGAR
jgi:tRNA A-37 threonylcarbamoyl transferase component Bud32